MGKIKKPPPPNLPPPLRAVLERHGVIEPAPAPELGELIGSVRRLGGTLTLRSLGELGYAATVEMDGGSYDAGDGEPALAVAEALAQALTATFPAQSEMFEAEEPVKRDARQPHRELRRVYAGPVVGGR